MNRNDVIDVLAVVAAATRRTVGEADVAVWQEIIGELDKELALRAVRDLLRDKPDTWMQPGHVYQQARAIRRDELEREPDEVREARMEALAAKAAEDVEELAERKGLPSGPAFRPSRSPALSVACPWCRALPGRPCVVPNAGGQPAGRFHPSRVEAAVGHNHPQEAAFVAHSDAQAAKPADPNRGGQQ